MKTTNAQNTEPRRNRRQEQKAATRSLILDTAAQLFATHGFDSTSIADICAAADVSRGLVHYHFASKEQLVEAVEEQVFQELMSYVHGAMDITDRTPETILKVLDDVWQEMQASELIFPLLLTMLSRALSDDRRRVEFMAFVRKQKAVIESTVTKVLGEWLAHSPIDVAAITDLLLANLVGMIVLMQFEEDPAWPDTTMEAFKAVLANSFMQVLAQTGEKSDAA